MFVVMRADASRRIGIGHVMRCLALARVLADAGDKVAFAVDGETVDVVPQLCSCEFETVNAIQASTLKDRWPDGCDLAVVDHYSLDADFERALRPWAHRIMAIDDLANRLHDCDVLLDQTAGRTAADYQSLVHSSTRLLVGSDYALLRPEFAAARNEVLRLRSRRSGIKRILVSMGGADSDEITGKVLKGITLADLDAHVDVVIGSGAPHLECLRTQIESMANATLTVDATDMAERMAASDLAIGAAGTTSWERCCLAVPSLIIIVAENQKKIASALENAGAAKTIGSAGDVTPNVVASAILALREAPDALARMSRAAAAITDGCGAKRVATILHEDVR